MRSVRGKLAVVVIASLVMSAVLLVRTWNPGGEVVPVHASLEAGGGQVMVMSLYPSHPVVMEGDSFRVTCLATGADRVFFELPNLSRELRSSVKASTQEGGAILVFKRVELGHQAKYVCHAVDKNGMQKNGIVDMVVSQRDKKGAELGEQNRDAVRKEEERGGDKGRRAGGDEEKSEGGEEKAKADNGGVATTQRTVPSFDSMEDRAKYQREQVDAFCKRHDLDGVKYKLPTPNQKSRDKNIEVYSYNRHMLLDDKHKLLFCFVPKVGCTNLKLLVFVSQGIIGRSELTKKRDSVNQYALEAAMFKGSFISTKDDKQKQNALHSYYKFTMFRNPLERLASSYRSKVERFPLRGLRDTEPHFNWLRKDIYSTQRRQDYILWKKNGGRTPVNISFADFVEYWANHPIVNKIDGYLDEHFLLISDMCQPCRTRFDFYGNFHHFDRDAEVLIGKIGASRSDLRQGYYSENTSTEERMKLYYSILTDAQKKAVLNKMALELEFHYTIFPEERDSHKQILNTNMDIPLS